ncbi:MAG TPA: hypothetical protein VII49_10790 [Rhizomicrobium sp.]
MLAYVRIMAAGALAATLTAAFALAAPVQAAGSGDGGAYHLYQTPEQMLRTGRVPPRLGAGSMEYFGGSVFSSVKVVSVIWGPNVNPQTVAGMPGFLTALPNSTYVDQLSIYDTNMKGVNGHKGTHQNIKRGTFISQVQITPKNTNTTLTDKMVQKELDYQIDTGALPMNDPNTLYMIYFPNNITITLQGLVSCQSFGAYHYASSKTVTSSNIFYGVMPDCGYTFDDHTIVSSHEYAEATTDNIPTPGTNPAYPQAWNTSDGYEIGDLCEGTQATLTAGKTTYYVQELYLNNLGGCGTANFTSP